MFVLEITVARKNLTSEISATCIYVFLSLNLFSFDLVQQKVTSENN